MLTIRIERRRALLHILQGMRSRLTILVDNLQCAFADAEFCHQASRDLNLSNLFDLGANPARRVHIHPDHG